MNYYDQHVHSSFSFDSQTELSDYLKHADGCFVTTEHVDLENSANHFMDSWMDYDRYSLYLENLQKNTDIRLGNRLAQKTSWTAYGLAAMQAI